MIEPGQRIGDRYVVERMLARGGMATVWIVKHEKLHSLHAMKVLDISTADIRRRLIQEGRLQASLRHPNIVAVTDTLEIDNQPALVMEYVDGPTLGKWLEDNDCPLDLVEKWFVQIVSAVAYAHARGLVHRDLKPDNVLLAPMSGDLLPKVADFGIAKVLAEAGVDGGADAGRKRTVTGVALGTPSYMPPEQVASAAEVDHRADVFALGCILYEMVCGKQAFSGDSLLQVFARIAEGDYEPPEKTAPDLPKRVIAAIKGCLEPDPARRIADCETLLAVFRGEKAAPKPAPRPRRTRSDDAPQRSGWGLWIAAAGLGVGGVASVTAVAAVLALVVVALAGIGAAVYVSRTSASSPVVIAAGDTDTGSAPATVAPAKPVPEVLVPITELLLEAPPKPAPRAVPTPPTTPLGQSADVLGWNVTVHGARTAVKVQESVFEHAADEGQVLVLVDVTVRYDGAGEESPFFPSKVIGPWGDEYSAVLACEMALPKALDASSTFAKGETRRGEACFHVPTAQTGLKYQFKPVMTRDDAVVVALPL